jgi:phosphatidylinositol kinase/protein kinase (PI-3  family)
MSETLWLDVAPLADFCRSSLMQLKEMSEGILLVTDLQRKFRRDVLPLIDHRINSQTTRRDREFQKERIRNPLTSETICPWKLFVHRMTSLHAEKGWSIFTDEDDRVAAQKELQLEIEMIQRTRSFRNPLKFVSDLSPNLNDPAIRRFPMFGFEGVRIERFCECVEVLGSGIGRPRKMAVMGSDGKKYPFLVKGHEDLRLDQRVMQFFTLVNTYLTSQIRTYRITPLTGTLGLIQWVDQCPSLRELIRAYDESFGTEGMFHFLETAHSPPEDSEKLSFFNSLLMSTGMITNSLREMMWSLAPDSSTWLRYQLNFPRTLAVMSMVGYAIGLGDRHCENILFDELSGAVIHIDFGICFDEAQDREYSKEHVKFRLTRTLIAALGPNGYNGTFRRRSWPSWTSLGRRRVWIKRTSSSGG